MFLSGNRHYTTHLDHMCSFDYWYLVTVKTVFLSRHRLFYPDILLKCAVSTLCIVLGAKPVSGAQIDIPSSTKLTWHLARMCSFHSWYIVAAKNCVLRRNQHFAWHLAQMCSIHFLYLLGAKTVSGAQIDIPSSTNCSLYLAWGKLCFWPKFDSLRGIWRKCEA